MAMRIKIGSYIIDADGDTSTTTGVTFLPSGVSVGDSDPGNLFWETSEEESVLTFSCHIEASGVAALKTRRDALEDAIVDAVGDIVIESDDDTTLKNFQTSTGLFTISSGRVIFDQGELLDDGSIDCLADVEMRIVRRIKGSGSGTEGEAQDPEGLTGTLRYNADRDTSGLLTVAVEASFTDEGGTDARTHALNWISELKARTGTPSFLDSDDTTNLRHSGDQLLIEPSADDDSFSGQVTAQAIFKEFPSGLASQAALQVAAIRDISYTVNLSPRVFDKEAESGLPGNDVEIRGSILTKTEGLDTFDSNDSAPSALTDAEFASAIDAIKSDAETRVGTSITVLGLTRGRVTSGEIPFVVTGQTSDNDFVSWQEEVNVRGVSSESVLTDSSGQDRVYAGLSVGSLIVDHVLSVQKISGAHKYKEPPIVKLGEGWRVVAAEMPTPRERQAITGALAGEVVTVFETQARVTYQKLSNKGSNILTLVKQISGN